LALYRERPFGRLLIWARDSRKAEALGQRLASALPAVAIEIAPVLEQAVRRADVVMTATAAREPILRGEWLRPGQHITAVGADDPQKCELDSAALTRARVFVDSVETTLANGDVARWVRDGAYAADRLAGEIGDVVVGKTPGRLAETDITIAKFVGIGAQDLVAAETALRRLEDD
jgi:ornithine cyclodeaminase